MIFFVASPPRIDALNRLQLRRAFEADLLVFIGDKRPDRIEEFGSTRRKHEAEGRDLFFQRAPTRQESSNGCRDLSPHFLCRTKDHFRSQNRIDLKSGRNRLATGATLRRVATR